MLIPPELAYCAPHVLHIPTPPLWLPLPCRLRLHKKAANLRDLMALQLCSRIRLGPGRHAPVWLLLYGYVHDPTGAGALGRRSPPALISEAPWKSRAESSGSAGSVGLPEGSPAAAPPAGNSAAVLPAWAPPDTPVWVPCMSPAGAPPAGVCKPADDACAGPCRVGLGLLPAGGWLMAAAPAAELPGALHATAPPPKPWASLGGAPAPSPCCTPWLPPPAPCCELGSPASADLCLAPAAGCPA